MKDVEDFNVCMTNCKTFQREIKELSKWRNAPCSAVRIEVDKLFLKGPDSKYWWLFRPHGSLWNIRSGFFCCFCWFITLQNVKIILSSRGYENRLDFV